MIQAHRLTELCSPKEAEHDVCLFGCVWSFELVNKNLDLGWEAWGEVEDCATPEVTLFEGSEVKACDDTKVCFLHRAVISTSLSSRGRWH